VTTELGLCLVVAILVFALIYQQQFYMGQIQTLVDKMKSGSFESYARAAGEAKSPREIKVPLEIPDDLRDLQEFTT
jgi:hypothetical protein